MSDVVEVKDLDNNVTLQLVEFEKTYEISFVRFEPVPVSVTITVPKQASEKALRGFITDVYVNEDVLANLLNESIKRL